MNSRSLAAQPDAVGRRVAILDAHHLSRLEIVPLDEAQELAVLIADAADRDRFAERTGQQRVVLRAARACPSGPGIGSPWGSADGPAEHLVDALDQPIRDGVLEVLGLVVDFGPAHPHHLDQEELDQPMPAQHPRGELLAGRVSRTPA